MQLQEYLASMKTFRLSCASVSLLLFAAACGPSIDSLEGFKHPNVGGPKRASFEMGCPEQDLQIVDLGPSTVGVTGCGKRAVYKYVWGTGWVNNTATTESASPAASPAAPPAASPTGEPQ